jgi:hypothetical protein
LKVADQYRANVFWREIVFWRETIFWRETRFSLFSTFQTVPAAMTVSYSNLVFTSRGCGTFLKLLRRWVGSIYKLVWKELIIYVLVLYNTEASAMISAFF